MGLTLGTGRENDGTGLYYFRARYYDPTLQRFVSQDPIGFAGGDANLYGYVDDDPGDLPDPLGLYGTSSCNYYTQDCNANGGTYACNVAPLACNSFPKSNQVSDCMRQCLQEQNLESMPAPNECSSSNQESSGGILSDHAWCLAGCTQNSQNPYVPNGPALPDKDINLY